MKKEERDDIIRRFEDDTDIDLGYMLDDGKYSDVDELMEDLRERVYEIEVIYYSNAMEYLTENDISLRKSIELAIDAGCDMKNVSSETLATLLKQQNVMETVEEYRDELSELFE